MNFKGIMLTTVLIMSCTGTVLAQSHTVFLLRHAEKATEPSTDPILSDAGMRRAENLAALLMNARPVAIYTSQYKRTQLTGKPLSDAVGIAPTILPIDKATAGDYPTQLLQRICAHPTDSSVVVIGHSNTIPEIAKAWTGHAVPPIADNEYNRILIIKLTDCQASGLLDLRY